MVVAIAFSHGGRLRYWAKQNTFPSVAFWNGAEMPDLPPARNDTMLTDIEEVDPADWLSTSDSADLATQTLYQRDGYAMTLLVLETDADEEDDNGVEDAIDRFSRFSSNP